MRAVIQRVQRAHVSIEKRIDLQQQPKLNTSDHLLESQTHTALTTRTDSEDSSERTVVEVGSSQILQEVIGEIGHGLVVLLGVGREDRDADVAYLVDRTLNLRIFNDEEGKMNLSLLDVGGSVLVVSQFTLYGDTRKGRRPSFFDAMDPTEANGYYMSFCKQLRDHGVNVQTGRFGEHMQISLTNDGPVTLMIDSKKTF